ncbi:MAG: spore maturation protein [Clostridia bacterium]|nr:spore maturation protein [Clostridia bacterium]
MAYILPALVVAALIIAVRNKAPVYQLFLEGAEDGIKMLFSIMPPMIAVLSMAAMLKASGLLGAVTSFLSPYAQKIGVPSEILPLALLRPFSGGGALGLLTDTVKTYGADSRISRAACILCASTETTFYTISVYFRRTNVKHTKPVIFAAVFGDLVGILCACWLSKINF